MNRLALRAQGIFSIVVLLLGAAWTAASRPVPGATTAGGIPQPVAGFKAPDFTLRDRQETPLTLSELRGQAVLVNLWASWCGPCKAEMPAFQRTYQEYKDQGFTILAVNATNQDSADSALAFADAYGLTFPILFDTDGAVSRQYRLSALPTSFFIGRDGTIREVVVGGPISEARLRVRVQQLLDEEAD